MSEIAGLLIAEWPTPQPGLGVNGRRVRFYDAATGAELRYVWQATFHVAASSDETYADLMLPVDAAGNRIPEFQPDKKRSMTVRYGEFRFVVAEMRIRPPDVPKPGDAVCYAPVIDGATGGGPCQPAVIAALGDAPDDVFADLRTPDGDPLARHAMRYESGPGYWGNDDFAAYCGGTWHAYCRAWTSG